MSLQWSPGDLRRQRLVVGRAIERVEHDRRRLTAARRQVAERLRALAVPLAVSASVVAAGFAISRYVAARGRTARRPASRADGARTGAGRVQSLIGLAMGLAQIYLRVRTLLAPPAKTASPTRVR